MFLHRLTLVAALLCPAMAQACETALVLTIDVSNSIDPGEYRVQADGMADALQDPEIIEAMVQGEVAIAVVQWSGEDRQEPCLSPGPGSARPWMLRRSRLRRD